MEMIPREFPGTERAPSPRVTSEEKRELIKQYKAEDNAERSKFEVLNLRSAEQSEIEKNDAAAGIEPLHNRYIVADQDPARKQIQALKAEINAIPTEKYMQSGRGAEAMQVDRDAYLAKQAKHDAMMRRGEEVRKARQANESLLGRFKNSLATMSERIFGKPPLPETKPGNESSAERPE